MRPTMLRSIRFVSVTVLALAAAACGGGGGTPAPPVNVAPVASFTATPPSGTTPLAVSFNATASTDADGTIASFAWAFGDGATATGAITSHTYATAGTFTATLTVTDNKGATGSTTRSITANAAPTASFTATPSSGAAPLAVAFNGSASSDSDGTIASFAWVFGDGGTATGATANHTYAGIGSFTARLTVTDNRGATGTTTRTITVTAPPGGFNNTANLKSPLGSNLTAVVDFANEFPFVDHMKMARPFFSGTAATFQDSQPLALDADGWPSSLSAGQVARTVLFTGPDEARRAGSRFVVLKSGDGDVAYDAITPVSLGATRDVIQLNASLWIVRITRTNPANPVKFRIVPEGGICNSNPLLKVAAAGNCPGGDFKSFEAADAPRFNPQFLETIKAYGYLRFMDWGSTNRTVQNEIDGDADLVNFSDRARVSNATWTRPLRGVPVEIMVDLGNLMNSDIWINIPHRASDNYVDGVAAIIRDRLEAGRKVYVEYSNEVWNGIFVQTTFARDQGIAAGLGTDDFTATIEFYSRRSRQVMQRFETVFGGAARLQRVMATLQGNGFAVDTILGFENAAAHVDFFAIAPYFGDTAGEGSFPLAGRGRGGTALTPEQEIAKFKAMGVNGIFSWLLNDDQIDLFGSLADIRFNTQQSRDAAQAFGKPLISYEGGQHFVGIGIALNDNALNALFDAVNRDPRIGQVYAQYLSNWRTDTGQTFTHFVNCDAWSIFGRWGALEFPTQARADAPKYDALRDYIEAQPLP